MPEKSNDAPVFDEKQASEYEARVDACMEDLISLRARFSDSEILAALRCWVEGDKCQKRNMRS